MHGSCKIFKSTIHSFCDSVLGRRMRGSYMNFHPFQVVSPPQHADELLYNPDWCACGLEWHCIPHDACFIHDSCLCEGSGSFPPVKPQRPSWAQFSYDWYCELAARLSVHPHSPLPRFGSEEEPDIMFFGLSSPP